MIKKNTYTIFDSLATNRLLGQKKANQEKPNESMEHSQSMILKIEQLCDELISEIKNGKTKLDSRQSINAYNETLQRLFEDITTNITLTSNFEDASQQADRWKITVQKFLKLYIAFLENCRQHPTLLAGSEIKEYEKIIADDFLQDLDRSNHVLYELILRDITTPKEIVAMMQDYR